MLLLFVLSAFFALQCLADDVSDFDFEQFLTLGEHLSCNVDQRFPPLHRAAMKGNLKTVTKILLGSKESGDKCINYKDSEGMTALHWASLLGHGAIVRSLLESGANISSQDKGENTALHLATYGGDVKSVRWLVIFGVDLNAKNQNGSTALHLAVEKELFPIVEELINSCASINATDFKGRTPLDLAVVTNNFAIITLLRALGASSVPKFELYRWVNKTAEDFDLPSCTVKGGKTYGGLSLYIGRIWDQNGYIPAAVIPYHKKTITVIGGKYREVSVDFQVLCGKNLAWKPTKADEDVPETAVEAGTSSNGGKLYIGRAYVSYSEKEVMTLGQVSETDRVLNMPFYSNDRIVLAKDYEILIVSH